MFEKLEREGGLAALRDVERESEGIAEADDERGKDDGGDALIGRFAEGDICMRVPLSNEELRSACMVLMDVCRLRKWD